MGSVPTEHIESYRFENLIATYEEVYEVPEPERITSYLADHHLWVLKYGVTRDKAIEVYKKGLDALGMNSAEYYNAPDFVCRGPVSIAMWHKKGPLNFTQNAPSDYSVFVPSLLDEDSSEDLDMEMV